MAHNGGGLAVQLPDIGRLVGHFDGVVTQVNGVKNEIAKFNNLAPLAQADAILRQLQQMQQDQQDYRQQAREDQQDYRQQAQEDQRILREQITDMQQGLRDVQDELRLQGRSLNDMRQQITDEFVQLEQRVQDRLRTVQQDIIAGVNGNINQLRADLNQLREAMITSQKAIEHNNSARVINHDAAVFRHCPLFPLRCFETNDVPDGFPATLDELNDLQGAELDHLLNAFHLRQPQSNEEKKDALKLFFGCRPASYPA